MPAAGVPCGVVRGATVTFVCAATIKGNTKTAVAMKASFIHPSAFFWDSNTKHFMDQQCPARCPTFDAPTLRGKVGGNLYPRRGGES